MARWTAWLCVAAAACGGRSTLFGDSADGGGAAGAAAGATSGSGGSGAGGGTAAVPGVGGSGALPPLGEASPDCIPATGCLDCADCLGRCLCLGSPPQACEAQCGAASCGTLPNCDGCDRCRDLCDCLGVDEPICDQSCKPGPGCESSVPDLRCGDIAFETPECDACARPRCCDAVNDCLSDPPCMGYLECLARRCSDAPEPMACAAAQCADCAVGPAVRRYLGIARCMLTECPGACGPGF